MESLHFPHFQVNYSNAYIALFRNVSNSENLKNRIISASITEGELGDKEREAVNFAFIDARLVS
jgi:EKC/KEOPS complex subunit CGI121/TPRKB